MSTKAIRDLIDAYKDLAEADYRGATPEQEERARAALAEVEAIERAAKTLSELHVGDFVYSIRDRMAGDVEFQGDSWKHPSVKAWSDASVLLADIAKQGVLMAALPLRVTFLSPAGEVLGWKMLTPSGGNWRALNRLPRVSVFRKGDSPFPQRDCERYEGGWAVRLRAGEPVPLKIEAMEVEAK